MSSPSRTLLTELGVDGGAYAEPIDGGRGVGFCEHGAVSPGSVLKIQIALAVEELISEGIVDGTTRRRISVENRTPGPVGMSLMRDEISMSVRDLVVAMLTVSDNVATDHLIEVAGLERINGVTRALGLEVTRVTSAVNQF